MANNIYEQSVIDIFLRALRQVDKYSNKYKIDDIKLRFRDNDTTVATIAEATVDNITITKDLIISITLNNGNKTDYVVKIPVPSNGVFVFVGKVRLNLNYLTSNKVCKITDKHLMLDQTSFVQIYPFEKNGISLHPGLYLKDWDEFRNPKYLEVDEIDLTERDPLIPKKLKILFELDSEPTVIDQELFDKIRAGYDLSLRDNICNKMFVNTSGMFLNHLKDSSYELVKNVRQFFIRNGVISTNIIQAIVDKFFNLRSVTSVGLQVPNNLNPISYNSLKNKIILSKGDDIGVAYSRMDASYTDFIDMIVTPDNKNVNRLNEMTEAIRLDDSGAYIKCYDPSFNRIEVEFMEYISSSVLTSSCVDYKTKTIKELSQYDVKVGGRIKTIPTLDFTYIEIEPDMRLSKSVRMIPMINHSDSVRVSMGARMMSQSIEVVGGELPIVSTGYESMNSDLSRPTEISGTVIDVDNDKVTIISDAIEEGGSRTVTIYRPDNLEGIYGTNISFRSHVVPGQRVEKGDLIYTASSMDKSGNIRAGVNCMVAQINAAKPYLRDLQERNKREGYFNPENDHIVSSTYEDALVVSKSTARKFAHMSIVDIDLVIMPNYRINGCKLPSATPLTSNDVLVDYEYKLDKYSRNVEKLKKELLSGDSYYKKATTSVPLNIREAYLVDVKFVYGDTECTEEETQYQIEEIVQNSRSRTKIPVEYDYNLISLNDFNIPKGCSYVVKFRLVVVNHLEVGDKITNRYGSKGVVAGIEDDENMPYIETLARRCDVMMNPSAVISRKNIPQTMELYLTKLASVVQGDVQFMYNQGSSLDDIRQFLRDYKFMHYANLGDEELLYLIESKAPFKVITGCYSSYTIEDIINMFRSLDIEAGEILRDGRTGRRIHKPVICGDMYLVKLYHLADKKAQVTVDHSIKPKFVLGHGKESVAGLKQGTMETDALIANNLKGLVDYIDGNDQVKAGWILAYAVTAGFGIE